MQEKIIGAAKMKKKINRNFIFPIILFFFFILFVFNDTGIIKWYHLRKERNQIKNDIKQILNTKDLLTEEINRLENDDEYIKKIAIKKFHMVKPGEKIFRIMNKRNINNE
tara:strand:- start:673 stop:1002 length:330 start_codon:yes stop_codon:yes gene_type:complete